MKKRYGTGIESEHAQMLLLLLEMVGEDGVAPPDAAQFVGFSGGFTTEILSSLRAAGRAQLVRNFSVPRIFLWCQPQHAEAIEARLMAEDLRREAARGRSTSPRLRRYVARNPEAAEVLTQTAYEDDEGEDDAPPIRRIVPAASAPRPAVSITSVFDLGRITTVAAA